MTARPPAPDRYTTTPAETTAVLAGIAALILAAAAITGHWPFWATALTAAVCCPLVGTAVYAALGAANRAAADRRIRIRIRYQTWPQRAVVLADTPGPHCPYCRGDGSITEPYTDAEGEYGGEHTYHCECWTAWHRTLLPVPRHLDQLLARRAHRRALRTGGYSDEPPF